MLTGGACFIQAVSVSFYTQALFLKGYPRNGCLYINRHSPISTGTSYINTVSCLEKMVGSFFALSGQTILTHHSKTEKMDTPMHCNRCLCINKQCLYTCRQALTRHMYTGIKCDPYMHAIIKTVIQNL